MSDKKFYVSWDNLQREARRLARRQLPASQWKGIIAVSRGGLVPAALMARELGIPYAAINVVANYAAGRADSSQRICFDSIETVLHEAMGRVRKVLEHLCTV